MPIFEGVSQEWVEEGAQQRLATARRLALDEGRVGLALDEGRVGPALDEGRVGLALGTAGCTGGGLGWGGTYY